MIVGGVSMLMGSGRSPVAQDPSTYTEVDPNNDFATTSTQLIVDTMLDNIDAYIYYDFGAGFWSGDFRARGQFVWDAATGSDPLAAMFLFTNTLDDWNGLNTAKNAYLGIQMYRVGAVGATNLYPIELVEGVANYGGAANSLSLATTYYVQLRRDNAVGTFGTLYLEIYSDATYTTLVTSSSLALHAFQTFRYFNLAVSYNNAAAVSLSFTLDSISV